MKKSIMTGTMGALFAMALSVSAAVPKPSVISAAKTAADHEAIAKEYTAEAKSLDQMAATHGNLARTYGQAGGKPWQAAQAKHCRLVAAELHAAAKEERALAEGHEKMAKSVGE